ncbi:MAG: hypothetical protein V4675_17450 [Verrucomicrobiota bacterium]
MALKTYLYTLASLEVLSWTASKGDHSRLVWLDEHAYCVPLCWLALFRIDDLLEYSGTYQPMREVPMKSFEPIGPRPEPVTEKRIAPVALREKALLQLEQSKAILAEIFPDHPNLPAWLEVMKLHLEKHPLPWLAIEWTDLVEAGGDHFFWEDIRWIMEGWSDPKRTKSATLSKTLLDLLLFRTPAVRVQSWRDELMKWAGLDLSIGIPSPAAILSGENAAASNANFYSLHPCLEV